MVCLLKDVKVQLKVRRTLSSVGTASSNIHESVAMGETLLTHIRIGENLADFLTKTTSGTKCRKLVSGVVHDIYDDFQQ